MKDNIFDLIVVGGGASGLMAAISAARLGAQTAILDHHTTAGKKLLATGNGKCNFTNQMQGSDCYRCDDPAFVLQVLEQYPVNSVLDFFDELGVPSKDRQGYYYPRNGQASSIRDALLAETKRLHIPIFLEVGIRNIQKVDSCFVIQTKEGDYTAKTCIFAAGGKASPKTGSDGSGFIYAKKLGHTINEPLPALVPLICEEPWLKQTAGVRCDASVSLFVDDVFAAKDCGEVQMTDYGISGIPVFQISRFASVALNAGQNVTAVLDFLPEFTTEKLEQKISKYVASADGEKTFEELIGGLVNKKIAGFICQELSLDKTTISQIPVKKSQRIITRIVKRLKETRLSVVKTKGFDQAQVTCGGIRVSEVEPTNLQSKLVSGLFFAGEILDVDGICGGYNLQWAWSSGYVAGSHAVKYMKTEQVHE